MKRILRSIVVIEPFPAPPRPRVLSTAGPRKSASPRLYDHLTSDAEVSVDSPIATRTLLTRYGSDSSNSALNPLARGLEHYDNTLGAELGLCAFMKGARCC